ncbi:MAG: 2-dehydropantoate 2-reductase N-terminal domain-containing protein [Methylovulum sp.]|nr:2-dehydropantoate 2-reductase N-terminal domain-containing protein [Methylovulum sp.]MDD2723404.1 2-dehydropantoate 2-reductase N-terminal domain-containing protein [Methylovulum sp.]
MSLKVLIVGAGAIGTFYGALLAKACCRIMNSSRRWK